MADYFTHFSCLVDVGTPENAACALDDPEPLIPFVTRCATEFSLGRRWGFQYANTCSRLRLDGFGGGAHVLDLATGDTVAWTDTDGWLAEMLSDDGERT